MTSQFSVVINFRALTFIHMYLTKTWNLMCCLRTCVTHLFIYIYITCFTFCLLHSIYMFHLVLHLLIFYDDICIAMYAVKVLFIVLKSCLP